MIRGHYYTVALLSALVLSACVDEDEIASPEKGQTTPSLSSVRAEQLLEEVPERSTDAEYAQIAMKVPGFGGMFIDAGTPTVYLVDASQRGAAQAAVGALIQEWRLLEAGSITTLGIQVRQAQYDWLQLLEWRQLIRDFLAMPGVVSLDIDEAQNRLALGVETLERKQVLEHELERVGVPTDAVIIREDSPTVPVVSLRDRVRPVRGGLQIYLEESLCTLSFNTYQNGYSFITASHCSDEQGAVDSMSYYQPTLADTNYIGTEVKDPPFFTGYPCPTGRKCRYSDANLSKYDSQASVDYGTIARTTSWGRWEGSLTIDGSSPRFDIVDEGYAPAVGLRVYKMGRTTGWTGWDVSYTCEDRNVAQSNITLLCQTGVPAGVWFGDSGSPVFSVFPNGRDVRLWGVLWGGNQNGTEFVFSRIYQVEAELGSLPTELLEVEIYGPTEVPPSDVCQWEAYVEGGIPPYSYKWYRDGDLVSTQYYYLTYDTGEPDTYWHLWVDVTDSGQKVNSDGITVYVDYDFECSA